jgi:hypothetical protein
MPWSTTFLLGALASGGVVAALAELVDAFFFWAFVALGVVALVAALAWEAWQAFLAWSAGGGPHRSAVPVRVTEAARITMPDGRVVEGTRVTDYLAHPRASLPHELGRVDG